MKSMSTKRAAIERQKTIVYAEILDERGEFCECCGAPANDMSHNYPRAPFVWLGDKHVGDCLRRMVKSGLLILVKPGVFITGNGKKNKPASIVAGQTKLEL